MGRQIRMLLVVAPAALILCSTAQFMRENYRELRRWAKSPGGSVDEVTAFEARYAPAAVSLPSQGQLGFRLQAEIPPVVDADAYRLKQFYLAQYTLAPRVLVRLVDERVNVVDRGDFVEVERTPADNVDSVAERPDHRRSAQPVAK